MIVFCFFLFPAVCVYAQDDICTTHPEAKDAKIEYYYTPSYAAAFGGNPSTYGELYDHYLAVSLVSDKLYSSVHESSLSWFETLVYVEESDPDGFYICPDGLALIGIEYHQNDTDPYLKYNCSEMGCGVVGVADRHWVPNNGDKKVNDETDPDRTRCGDEKIACGACFNPGKDPEKCKVGGTSYTYATRCCAFTVTRNHCEISEGAYTSQVATNENYANLYYWNETENPNRKLECVNDNDIQTALMGTTFEVAGGLYNATTSCSKWIEHVADTRTQFTAAWMSPASCIPGDALISVQAISNTTYQITCGSLECAIVGHQSCIYPETSCPDGYVATGVRCALYELLDEFPLNGCDDEYFTYKCCEVSEITTTPVTYSTTTTITTTTTKTTVTSTTITTGTFTVSYQEPSWGCNETLYCLPACSDTGNISAYFEPFNFSQEWPCYQNCSEIIGNVCVILPYVGDHAFASANYIYNLFIRGNFNNTDELHYIGEYGFTEMPELNTLIINATIVDNISSTAFNRTDCGTSYGDLLYNKSAYPVNIDDCSITTTTTSTASTATTTTTITVTSTSQTMITDPPKNISNVVCPSNCTDETDIDSYYTFTNETNKHDLIFEHCNATHVCVRGPYLVRYMFNNMTTLESLVVVVPNSTELNYLEFIQYAALADVPNLKRLKLPDVLNGHINVFNDAFYENPCDGKYNDTLYAGHSIDVGDCVLSPTTSAPITTTASNTSNTTSTTTEKSGGGGSGSKRISDTEMITIIFGAIVGVLFVAAAVTLLCFTSKGTTAKQSAFHASRYMQFKPAASYFRASYEKVPQNARPNSLQKWNVNVDTF